MGNTYAEQLYKTKYSKRETVENLALVDTGCVGEFRRTVSPDGKSFNSFVQISGGVGWAGTRRGARAIANQGGQRGNGAFQEISNKSGAFKGEVALRERDVRRGNSGDAAALRAMAATTDGHLAQLGQTTEWMVMGDSVGMQMASGTILDGVFTITSHAEHVTRFRQDMLLVGSLTANGTSGSAIGAPSIAYVQKVGRLGSTPTLTLSTSSGGAAATPSGWPNDNSTVVYLFGYETYAPANGGAGIDGGTDGDESGFVFDTVESWNPAAAPGSSDSFKGMNRSVDDLLAGVRLTAAQVANLNILQRIEKLAILGRSRAGWSKNAMLNAYVHTIRFNEACQLLRREDMRKAGFAETGAGKGKTGYKYVEITCIGGDIRLMECPMYEPNICRMIDPKDWEIQSAGGFPQVVSDIDGLRWIRDPDTDSYVLQYSAFVSIRPTKLNQTAQCPLN